MSLLSTPTVSSVPGEIIIFPVCECDNYRWSERLLYCFVLGRGGGNCSDTSRGLNTATLHYQVVADDE